MPDQININSDVEKKSTTKSAPIIIEQTALQEKLASPNMLEQAGAQVQDAANQVQAQAQQFAGTAQQVAQDPTKMVGLVGDQVKNLGQAVGAQELFDEGKDLAQEMGGFIVHTLKIAFFLIKQDRVSRGEFMVGLLASSVVMAIVSALLPILLGGLGVALMWILIMIPIINLGIKRFHDLNKPARWVVMLCVPLFGWIMPLLFKGVNTHTQDHNVDGSLIWIKNTNDYGEDPSQSAPQDMQSYIIVVLGLLFVSTLLVSILSFVGIRVSGAPSIDDIENIDNPDTITEQTQIPSGRDNTNVRGF